MSYILDALAKADAERRHSTAAPEPSTVCQPCAEGDSSGRRWWVAATPLLVMAVVVLVWHQRHLLNEAPDTPPAQPPARVGSAQPSAPEIAPSDTPAQSSVPAPAPSPILAPVSQTPRALTPADRTPKNTPAPATKATSAPPAPAANAALPRPPASAPALAISGATYSDNPAHRLLIVNGKVVQEGQEVAPGVKLEAIGPRSAVFNQGGTRFNINHQ